MDYLDVNNKLDSFDLSNKSQRKVLQLLVLFFHLLPTANYFIQEIDDLNAKLKKIPNTGYFLLEINSKLQKINQMIIDGDVKKTFPAGSKIYLVNQEYSTIVIGYSASGRTIKG